MAELRSYNPTLMEKIAAILAGDSREGMRAARRVLDPLDLPVQFSPAGAHDLARSQGGDIKELIETVRAYMAGDTDDPISGKIKRQTRDEFFQDRRSKRMTLEETLSKAEADARASVEFKQMVKDGSPRSAERLVQRQKTSAEDTWKKSQATIGDEEASIEKAWQEELADRERDRLVELSKSFVERHPTLATAATVGGSTAAALLTRGVYTKLNRAGHEIAERAHAARADGRMGDFAEEALKGLKWERTTPWLKTGTAVGAAALPAELRMMGDIIDRKTLPEDAPARKRAEEKMGESDYWKGFGLDLFGGGVGAFTGTKLAGAKTAPIDVHGVTSHLRGVDARNLSPDQLATALAHRARMAEDESLKLLAQRRRSDDLRSGLPVGNDIRPARTDAGSGPDPRSGGPNPSSGRALAPHPGPQSGAVSSPRYVPSDPHGQWEEAWASSQGNRDRLGAVALPGVAVGASYTGWPGADSQPTVAPHIQEMVDGMGEDPNAILEKIADAMMNRSQQPPMGDIRQELARLFASGAAP